jgi:hypothetical protein
MNLRRITQGASKNSQSNYSLWTSLSNFWKQPAEKSHPNAADVNKDPVELIDKAFHDHTPPWFRIEDRERQQVQIETAHTSLNDDEFQSLLSNASKNLERWSQSSELCPQQVEVINGDWGVVTQQVSSKYGQIYGVINMADPNVCGGGSLSGSVAQEENMFARTTCYRHLKEESEHIYLGKDNYYRYQPYMKDLINAKIPMSAEELIKLSTARGKAIDQAYKIFMDTKEAEVCFKDYEIICTPSSSLFSEGQSAKAVALTRKEGSFSPLKEDKVFLFHEIRSAAVDLTDPDLGKNADWEDPEFLNWFRAETKRRIDAQLDTAILNGINHVILSAFGCGAFANRATEVAKIYRESIEERAEQFEHLVFAIYYPGYGRDNFLPFKAELDGISIGERARAEKNNRFRMGE